MSWTRYHESRRIADAARLQRQEDFPVQKPKAIGYSPSREHARADLRADLAEALLARLEGRAPRTAAARDLAGCTLSHLHILCDAAQGIPRNVALAGTTSDFPHILADTAEKHALELYSAQRPAVRSVTREVVVTTLHPATVAHLDIIPLAEVGDGGRIDHGVTAEGGEVMRMARYASITELSFEAITNDDLDAFRAVPEGAAEAVSRLESDLFFELLLANGGAGPTLSDGVAYFHSDHGNLRPAGALNAANLAAAAAAMRAQTSPTGARMNLAPRFLLTGPSLEYTAHSVVSFHTAGGADAVLEVLVDARIADASWYLLASPDARPAFVRGALFGRTGPSLVAERDFGTSAIRFRVTATAGVGVGDYRAGVRVPAA